MPGGGADLAAAGLAACSPACTSFLLPAQPASAHHRPPPSSPAQAAHAHNISRADCAALTAGADVAPALGKGAPTDGPLALGAASSFKTRDADALRGEMSLKEQRAPNSGEGSSESAQRLSAWKVLRITHVLRLLVLPPSSCLHRLAHSAVASARHPLPTLQATTTTPTPWPMAPAWRAAAAATPLPPPRCERGGWS